MRAIDLSGKAALITGGTRNIGRGITQALAEAGADVALFYRADEPAAERACAEIRGSTGRRANAYRVDVGREPELERSLARAVQDFPGGFHIVVHNAAWHVNTGGILSPDLTTEQWRNVFAVNLDAAFFIVRFLCNREGALPAGSSVVFISSGRGHGAAAGHAPYGTAKAALNHFAGMLAQDLGPRGVRVNVVSPGYIETDHADVPEEEKRANASRSALRRVGTPADVAGAVLFFASDLSAFVTGQVLPVNGGGV